MPAPEDSAAGEEVVPTVGRLVGAMEAAAAIAVLLGARTGRPSPTPAVDRQARAVAESLGIAAALDEIDEDRARWLAGFVRSTLGQAVDLVDDPAGGEGWRHTDPELLRATGDLSALFARVIHDGVLPALPGASERTAASGARFLDVGVGAGGLALAMARAFPALEVVGIDIWAPAIELARANIAAAGLDDRVVVHERDARALDEPQSYDLLWFPGPFVPVDVVPDALARCVDALKHDGWLIFARFGGADPLTRALADLRTVRAGGHLWGDDELLALLTDAGLRDARHVELGSGVPGRIAAARR